MIRMNPRQPVRDMNRGHGTRLMRDAPGLAAARATVGLTVEELAEAAGVPRGVITRLEAGKFENVLKVSTLQAFFSRQHGIEIREQPPE